MTAGDGDESDRPAEDDSSREDDDSDAPGDASPADVKENTQSEVSELDDGSETEGEDAEDTRDEEAEEVEENGTGDGDSDRAESAEKDDDQDEDASADGGGTTAGETDTIGGLPGDDEPGFDGAPDDEEMPLTEHIEEMLSRMLAVIVVMGVVSALVFPIADELINFFWYSFLPGSPAECAAGAEDIACPRVYHPLGLLLARLKVASLAGMILALPVFVYQTYLFMRPGLYPNERRYYLAAVPTSLVLAFVGVAFAYFLILPIIFQYFLYYSQDVADIAFGLGETFNLILLMMGLFAFIFQIPLFIMLAIMMGVTSRLWLEDKRIIFWFSFAGIAFLFSPDPTGMAPFIVALTMVVLFEGTLLLLRWTGR